MSEQGQWLVVTGASRGIGRAIALAAAARGLNVALLARDEQALAEVSAQCTQMGVTARARACDLADAASVESAAAWVLAECGVPHVLVHNAGVALRASLLEHTLESWRQVLAVNLDAVFVLTRALLPAMRARGAGRIVSVSSISATLGTPGLTSYCASKWGLEGFTKALAEELRGSGLQTMTVQPGSTDTDMLKGSGFAPQMQPEDVAHVVLYAALDAPAALHGAALPVFGP